MNSVGRIYPKAWFSYERENRVYLETIYPDNKECEHRVATKARCSNASSILSEYQLHKQSQHKTLI
jgi:hypothetical protein